MDSRIKRRSVERAVSSARGRAAVRAQSIIDAAAELVLERNDTDFTVTDLITRAHVSQRTFYAYFATKNDLLSALCNSILHQKVLLIEQTLVGESDPLLRLERAADRLFDLCGAGADSGARLNNFVLQMFLSNPEDFQIGCQPLIALFEALMHDLATHRRLSPALTPRSAAVLTTQVVLIEARSFAQGGRGAAKVDDFKREVWSWCVAGISAGDHRPAIAAAL